MMGRIFIFYTTASVVACQNYTFEKREPLRADAIKINEVIATVTPADILLVVDNSGSMGEEINELRNNVDLFLQKLSQSDNNFRLGIITTDVECNLPTKTCGPLDNVACCNNISGAPCSDTDSNGDGTIDGSNCDGGRLRSELGEKRIFDRPAESARTVWINDVNGVLNLLGTRGSSFESGLEAVRIAVACSLGLPECPDANVSILNQGFIRDEADLVLLFLTDEDDCSFRIENPDCTSSSRSAYCPPNSVQEQTAHLCSSHECYAYWLDTQAADGVLDDPARVSLTCSNAPRADNRPPPLPRSVNDYISDFKRFKGNDVRKIRAAGILGAAASNRSSLGAAALGCYSSLAGPVASCGCSLQSSSYLDDIADTEKDVYCAVTKNNGQLSYRSPNFPNASSITKAGCEAMPGGRYVQFLENLASARNAVGSRTDTLIDSICQGKYDQTLTNIVNNVILTNCFNLAVVPTNMQNVHVKLNHKTLEQVELNSAKIGWSYITGSQEICLEGGLSKNQGDVFEIQTLTNTEGTVN